MFLQPVIMVMMKNLHALMGFVVSLSVFVCFIIIYVFTACDDREFTCANGFCSLSVCICVFYHYLCFSL